jgi:hypothetical protein
MNRMQSILLPLALTAVLASSEGVATPITVAASPNAATRTAPAPPSCPRWR